MNCAEVLETASRHLEGLSGHVFHVLEVSKPISPNAAVNLSKVVSKLSPMLGNLIEFNSVEFLNRVEEYHPHGVWKRQDPGFPDTIFDGTVVPVPGFEIKAWFPLATEITARFKDSQEHFRENQTSVCVLAWLPEFLVFGKPKILDVCIVSGHSVAQARDTHYHNPPDYLVVEPGDTAARTRNLRQTNTNGYKWQGSPADFEEAEKIVESWGPGGRQYDTSPAYQRQLSQLLGRFSYRVDTNFAKMDRIRHAELEVFKQRVSQTVLHGMTVREWGRLICSTNDEALRVALQTQLGIREEGVDAILR